VGVSQEAAFLAVDLGAESGRVLSAGFDGDRVLLEEVHRFQNRPVRLPDGYHWDVLRIYGDITEGLAKAVGEVRWLEGVGVDSWAVDFALLDRNGSLISNPYHHRDPRTEGMIEKAFERVPKEEIYRTTGIQFLPINTLYQLLAMEESPLLEVADIMLLIPDLINYWLTGEKACELTNATTTQLYDFGAGNWAWNLLSRFGLPAHILPEIVPSAAELGLLLPEVAKEVGLTSEIPVTAVASHDTASAVVAVPAENENFAYISSGTWSLVGVEIPRPVVAQAALDANFTNEGGFGGTTRFLKNVMGLWLLQECRRTWSEGGEDHSYEELTRLAESAPAFGPLIDPDHPAFLTPGDMPSRIRSFCEETGQRPPRGPGDIARCVFESLALKYRWSVERAEDITALPIEVIHIVGGGSQNSLLCQLTADAARLPVVAGPVEATALGNAMVQAFARGRVGSLEDIRAVVRQSVEVHTYEPQGSADEWVGFRETFSRIMHDAPPSSALERG
jgi:rhamnulokinase